MRTAGVLFAFVVTLAAAGQAQAAADPDVQAVLDPGEIRLGETADLAVTVSAREADEISVPDVDGLDFESAGQSSSLRVVNGVVSASTTYRLRVSPRRAGAFTIPSIEVSVGGRTGRTAPVTLTVVAGSAPRAQTAPSRSGAGTSTAGDPAFLSVTPAKRELYVGERIPVEIRACFRAGQRASIQSLPRLEGAAFTLETPDKEPVRSEVTIEGQAYVALTWEGALSAVKEGDYPFEASLDATLVVPVDRAHPRRPSLGSDPFADDFFDSAFDSFFAAREQEATLRCEPQTLHVKPLPVAGRPATFSGAVGRFRLLASASPTSVAAGEPITLTTTVEGEGNFARVTAPSFPAVPGWKSYPAKGSFAPSDSSGSSGRKTFEQPVAPLGGDVKEIPPVEFSCFDPEHAAYVTLKSDPIPVTVTGAAVPVAREPEAAPAPGAPSLQRSTGTGTHSLRPAWENGWFKTSAFALLGALVAALVVGRRRQRGPRPAPLRRVRAETDRAIAQSDARAFFAAGRAAVQERLAPLWGSLPASITLAELRQRGSSADVRAFFEAADAVAYSGRAVSQEEMRQWQARVLGEIARMEGVR